MGENFSDEVQWNQWTTVENIAVLKTKYHIIIFPEQIFKNPGEVGQLHQGSLDRVQICHKPFFHISANRLCV